MTRLWQAVLWLHVRRRKVNAWIIRIVSFYFGYKILHHQVYGVQSAQPLLVFLGLWLCGVPPALFFDGLRRLGADVTGAMQEGVTDTAGDAPAPRPPDEQLPPSPHRRRDRRKR